MIEAKNVWPSSRGWAWVEVKSFTKHYAKINVPTYFHVCQKRRPNERCERNVNHLIARLHPGEIDGLRNWPIHKSNGVNRHEFAGDLECAYVRTFRLIIIDWLLASDKKCPPLTSFFASAAVLPSNMLIEYRKSEIEKGSNANCSGGIEKERKLMESSIRLRLWSCFTCECLC